MSARADDATAHAADLDEARDERYANPFAPPDETEAAAEARPRSLFGEILDWMLAPLLLLWPMSLAVTYLVAKSIANGPFDRALETDAYVLARQIHPVNGVAELSLPDSTRDFLRADNVDSVFYQVLGTRGELVGGEPLQIGRGLDESSNTIDAPDSCGVAATKAPDSEVWVVPVFAAVGRFHWAFAAAAADVPPG